MKTFRQFSESFGRYKLVGIYDLRPIDTNGKRGFLDRADHAVCNRCGKLHAKVYVVSDKEQNREYNVGSTCMKKMFGGWEPTQYEVTQAEKEDEKRVLQQLQTVAAEYAVKTQQYLKSLPKPQVEISARDGFGPNFRDGKGNTYRIVGKHSLTVFVPHDSKRLDDFLLGLTRRYYDTHAAEYIDKLLQDTTQYRAFLVDEIFKRLSYK